QALQGLQNNPNVTLIEADAPRQLMATGDVPTTGSEIRPFGIAMVQANLLSDANAGNRTVCIIDTGYSLQHEDLQDTNVTKTDDAGTGNAFEDGDGHGSHVAGTIAGLGGNGVGVVGVMPNGNVKLHIIKVFGNDGAWAYSSSLVSAVDKCRAAGSNVISMSLGGAAKSVLEQNAFQSAWDAGVLSIAAAGNDGTTGLSYPASYSSVVSVAAIDENKAVADFSQKNAEVDIAAPGVDVLSSVPYIETNNVTVNGTSSAGGHVEFAARSAGTSGTLVSGGICNATNTGWAGKVVLCERGTVSFFDKVKNVQTSGGAAAIIYNNVAGDLAATLGAGNSSTIPAISLSQESGQALVASSLGQTATVVSQVAKPVNGYSSYNGTSMATPHVAAVAALVWSYNPAWTNAQVRTALQNTAQDLGTAGRDNSFGYGLVQAKAALDSLQGTGGGGGGDTTAPVISNVTSAKTNAKRGTFSISWTTNEASNSVVTFTGGTTGSFPNASMVTSHTMSFTGTKGAVYTYTVSSTDAAGNTTTQGPFTHQN
ncbi:MAG: S8 family serine peptidase, partial [Ardenticatenales bacterium]|nr:S8 family serine peptidase [Ardenticatenales bacterium]